MTISLLTAIRNNQPTEKVNFYALLVRGGFISRHKVIQKDKTEKQPSSYVISDYVFPSRTLKLSSRGLSSL